MSSKTFALYMYFLSPHPHVSCIASDDIECSCREQFSSWLYLWAVGGGWLREYVSGLKASWFEGWRWKHPKVSEIRREYLSKRAWFRELSSLFESKDCLHANVSHSECSQLGLTYFQICWEYIHYPDHLGIKFSNILNTANDSGK